MTAAAPIPTSAESPLMDQTTEADPADPRPGSPSEALSPGRATSSAAAVRPTLRSQVAENPLASFFGAIVVALMVSMLTMVNIRINSLEDRFDRLGDRIETRLTAQDARINRLEARIDGLDAKFDAKFDELDAKIDGLEAKFDAKFDGLDAKFDEMNLKLTALIAALNATDDVDAAIEGRLTEGVGDPLEDPAGSSVGE